MLHKRRKFRFRLKETVKIGNVKVPISPALMSNVRSARYNKPYSRWETQELLSELSVIMTTGKLDFSKNAPFIINCNSKRKNILIGPYGFWIVARGMRYNSLIKAIFVDIDNVREEKRLSELLTDAFFHRRRNPYLESLGKILPIDKIRM